MPLRRLRLRGTAALRRPRFPVWTFAAICAGSIAGCAASAAHSPIASPEWIHVGETTRAQIVERLGQPQRTDTERGGPLAAWWESEPSIVGADRARELVVVFTPAGRVKSYELRSTFPADRESTQ